MTQPVWIRTGDTSAGLLRRGLTLPIPDLVIAALALEHRCQAYSSDRQFHHIPGLQLYSPAR
jgi:predicted nucleic acid-binding protein